jgi:hypothetical protein
MDIIEQLLALAMALCNTDHPIEIDRLTADLNALLSKHPVEANNTAVRLAVYNAYLCLRESGWV